jgi:ribosomal protein S18 acetylase RimI-like enzyme
MMGRPMAMMDSKSDIEVRTATADDHPAASVVQQACLTEPHPYQYANNILCTGTVNLVAVQNEAVVGFLSVLLGGHDPGGAHLWQRLRPYLAFVGVLPEAQRRGVGSMLVRHAAELLLHRIGTGVWVECRENLSGLYEGLGFDRCAPDFVRQATGLAPLGPVFRYGRKRSWDSDSLL